MRTQYPEDSLTTGMHFARWLYSKTNDFSPQKSSSPRWTAKLNPYVRGSYSNAVVGTSMADFHNLEGRVENVFFAGEGCDGEYFGYLQGAYYTAQRQTRVITDCLKGKECSPYQPEENDYCGNGVAVGGSTFDMILLCFFVCYVCWVLK